MPNYALDLRKIVGNIPLILCGAAVILVDCNERILLQLRNDNNNWGIPGGFTELNETLEETAKREVFEEVGLICHKLDLFGVYSGSDQYHKYPNGDEVHNVTVVYICTDYKGFINVDLTEGKDARFFPRNDLPENIHPPSKIILDDYRHSFA